MRSSSYEQFIIDLLKKNKINFKREQTFDGLKGFKADLRFDFVIYNQDGTIKYFLECNGEQHYKEIPAWGGKRGLQKRLEYDRKKMAYALAHNIPMICLPYWDINSSLTYDKLISNSDYKVKTIWHTDNIIKRGV